MHTFDVSGNFLCRTKYALGVRGQEVQSKHLLRLALPSEGLQPQLQERLWQLLKALFREFPVQHQEEVHRQSCLHLHSRTHHTLGHLQSVGPIRLEILERADSVPSAILDRIAKLTLTVDPVEVYLQESTLDPEVPG